MFAAIGLAQEGGADGPHLTPAQWREDLRYLSTELVRRHPNAFHTVSRAAFDAAVNELNGDIDSLAPHQIIVAMAQIGALLGDAHTYVDLPTEGRLAFGRLPIRLTMLSNGLFVSAATAEQRHLLGKRVARVGSMSVDDAFQRVAAAVSRDNESTLRFLVPRRMVMPEVLHAVGIIEDLNLQFNSVRDRADEPLADFALRLGDLIEADDVERLVIDLRRNIGGNSRLTYPLTREIIKVGKFEEPGRLFTCAARIRERAVGARYRPNSVQRSAPLPGGIR